MLKGISVVETVEYISSQDTGEQKTIFIIGNITHKDKLRIFSADVVSKTVPPEKMFDLLKAGLKGIKNLGGKDYNNIDDEVLELIPFDVLGELIETVVKFNNLGETERKN